MNPQNMAAWPKRGDLIRDYELRDRQGRPVMLSDFRGRAALVLAVWQGPLNEAQRQLLESLRANASHFRENEAQVIVIVNSEWMPALSEVSDEVLIVTDPTGNFIRANGAPVIYVTDKFREVFQRFAGLEALPTADELLGWAEFVSMQCPECHPPEWPTVG